MLRRTNPKRTTPARHTDISKKETGRTDVLVLCLGSEPPTPPKAAGSVVHPPQRGPTWLRSPGIGRRHASTAWSKWHLSRTMPGSASPASHQGAWMSLQGSRPHVASTSRPSFPLFTDCTGCFPVLGIVLRSVFGGTAGPGERTEGGARSPPPVRGVPSGRG